MLLWLTAACASAGTGGGADTPSEAARHRAALAMITVSNGTAVPLTIAFRSTMAPVQEVVIGRVAAAQRVRLAPVPAGEPIVVLARRADGAELALRPQSFAIDAEWIWEIPQDATFTVPEPEA
ncbi:MAG: hypothetical protein ACT443_00270 [Gemmatimonadota bacterium]